MHIISQKKKITIDTTGPLSVKGGVSGPIDIPYYEDVEVIGQMIMHRYKVYEHLSDGTKVALNVHNFNKENGTNDMKTTYQVIKSADELTKVARLNKKINSSQPVIDIYTVK